jgi:hypothetical protein
LFLQIYGEAVANALGIVEVPAEDVVQSPKLLKALKKTPLENPAAGDSTDAQDKG